MKRQTRGRRARRLLPTGVYGGCGAVGEERQVARAGGTLAQRAWVQVPTGSLWAAGQLG